MVKFYQKAENLDRFAGAVSLQLVDFLLVKMI